MINSKTANISFQTLRQLLEAESFFIVDQKVFDLYAPQLSFLEGQTALFLTEPEKHKTFQGFEQALNFFLEKGISREDKIVAIGGGATSDLAGFVASSILRGIEWICVPTTLLAIIDASIGGKTGINTSYGKNLVGSFHRPSATLVCLEFLETLAPEEVASGAGELLKYAFLSPDVYRALRNNSSQEEVMELCRDYKNSVVNKDFRESGERANLNLGHTFGHALERLLQVPHGIAVAMGIELVLELFNSSLLDEFYDLKKRLGVSFEPPQNINPESFWGLVNRDKKRLKNEIAVIVPQNIGKMQTKRFPVEKLKKRFDSHEKLKNIFQ